MATPQSTGAASPITMYARTRFCPDVNRARTRLSELGLAWEELDVEADAAVAAQMRALTGRGNVPTLLIGDRVLVEPSRQEIDDAVLAVGLAAIPAPLSAR
jgi:glutaredoxin